MSDKPASLLTKTQRQRLETEFADVEGAKRRRDQQAIRERIAAGLTDFEYLASYDEQQLAAALDDLDDQELLDVLADVTVVAERVRTLRDVDRDAVVERARERPTEGSLDLRTRAEREAAVAEELGDELGPTPWQRRAERFFQAALFFLVPAAALGFLAPDLASGPVGGIPAFFGLVSLLVGFVIVSVRGVKHDLVPAARALLSDPGGTVAGLWERI